VDELDPLVLAYYDRGDELDRLAGGFPSGPLELARTQELLTRHLPAAPLDVLDVGGGPGRYAAWLADLGHRVTLVDPIELHVSQARALHPDVTAEVGDARRLAQPDRSADAVLLLGPLYHLIDRADRMTALGEARRVLRPGGVLFAAAISRWASLWDLLLRLDLLHDPAVAGVVGEAVASGEHRGWDHDLFTTAYFHRPDDLAAEVSEAGFGGTELFNVEGPGFVLADLADRWADPPRREALMQAARLVEREPSMLGASSHILAVGHRPST
jgi:ubiquinone/menaquinone biosynthesis C-methylase UbiE